MWDKLILNAHVVTMRDGKHNAIADGAVGVRDQRIAWVGEQSTLTGADSLAREVIDVRGRLVTPALIDCHTHLVYAGNRADEWVRRQSGVSYEEITRAGGGINATVQATRAASESELFDQSAPRLEALMAGGARVVEIKSGYGLDVAGECKMLRVARRLGEHHGITVKTTFLGAHTVPREFAGRADAYVDHVVHDMLPRVADEGLADAVDAFCEGIGFTPQQTARVFEAATRFGLRVKLHADQLSNLGGAKLAAEFGALSADHVEYTDEAGVAAMAASGTVAVLLPAALYFLREKQLPPIDSMRKQGVPMAVATDCNPGTAPTTSPSLMLNMACTLFRLTPEEALAGMTLNAARALGIERDFGSIEVGKCAEMVSWDVGIAELGYRVDAFTPKVI